MKVVIIYYVCLPEDNEVINEEKKKKNNKKSAWKCVGQLTATHKIGQTKNIIEGT